MRFLFQSSCFSNDRSDSSGVFSQRKLYGGAMKMELPTEFLDVSEFRQVPDNQEVFVDANSNQSFIVELLESDAVPQNIMSLSGSNSSGKVEPSRVHFAVLADENNAMEKSKILHTESIDPAKISGLPPNCEVCVSLGVQAASKFNQSTEDSRRDFLWVIVGTIRLDKYKTDIVISCNIPIVMQENVDKMWQKFIEQAKIQITNLEQNISSGNDVLDSVCHKFKHCINSFELLAPDELFGV